MKNILLIEDNPEIQMLLKSVLIHHQLVVVNSLRKAKDEVLVQKFDLIILDIELPDGNGIDFLGELASDPRSHKIPVFVLTSHSDISRKVSAFSLGVDDFISKPFDPREIRARVDAKLRKTEELIMDSEIIRLSNIILNTSRQKSWIEDGEQNVQLKLTSLEFKLLATFVRNPEKIFSRDFLIREIWGAGTNITDRTVDTHVYNLRKKLGRSLSSIETVVGEGYRMISVNPPQARGTVLAGQPLLGSHTFSR